MKCLTAAALSAVAMVAAAPWAALAQADSALKDATAQMEADPASPDNQAPSLGRMIMGYTYFNRPGADLKLHDAEVADCASEAARAKSFDETFKTGASQGLVGALVGSAIQTAYHRGAVGSALENCMVVHGWRVVKLPDAEGAKLAKLPQADLAKTLAPWVGAVEPHGQIVRVWANDAANASITRYVIRPDHTNDGQLSLLEATSADLHQFDVVPTPPLAGKVEIDPKWPKKALTPTTLDSAPADGVIFLVQIKGLSLHNGTLIGFNRMGTDKDIAPGHTDHGPDALFAFKGTLFAHKEGDMFAFAVPAGKWRVTALGGGAALSLCLGSPSFTATAGEVVYAGSFDFGASNIGPNLDLAPARAWLGAAPQTHKLRAAVYTNGSRFLCAGNHLYALEVKGAPFEPGYVWGSAAASAALPAPAQTSAAPAASAQ